MKSPKMTLRDSKQVIRAFLRTEIWTEEKLCALLAHAQDKLSMWSCCCLIGAATAKHALRPRHLANIFGEGRHILVARDLPLACAAEDGFSNLSGDGHYVDPEADDIRRRRIRPIVRAELRRRARLIAKRPQAIEQEAVAQ